MFIDFLLSVFNEHKTSDSIIWKDKAYKYDLAS